MLLPLLHACVTVVTRISAIIASDPEPITPGLSPDDVLTLYFTRPTNQPDVSTTARVQALITFSPFLSTILRASWQSGGDTSVPTAQVEFVSHTHCPGPRQ